MTTTNVDEVRQFVDRAVRAAVPPEEMVQRRIRLESEYTWPEPTPLAGFRAAQQVRRLAEQHLYRHVAGLRGDGTSWREIADLLDIPWSSEYSRVERAFELTAGTNWSTPRVYWHCGGPLGCGQHITDHGPYEGYPSDCETGHVEGCYRLGAEDAARARDNDEAEQRAIVMDEAYALLSEYDRGIADRARDVLAHGGRYRGWSTGETLAVALALDDGAMLKQCGYSSRGAAIDRAFGGPTDRLARIRAAATGTPTDA